MKMAPSQIVRPTVVLLPTTEFKLSGHKMEPSVYVPSDVVSSCLQPLIYMDDPLLDPQGVAKRLYGFSKQQILYSEFIFSILPTKSIN